MSRQTLVSSVQDKYKQELEGKITGSRYVLGRSKAFSTIELRRLHNEVAKTIKEVGSLDDKKLAVLSNNLEKLVKAKRESKLVDYTAEIHAEIHKGQQTPPRLPGEFNVKSNNSPVNRSSQVVDKPEERTKQKEQEEQKERDKIIEDTNKIIKRGPLKPPPSTK